MELASPGIERSLWQWAPPDQLDIEAPAAQVPRQIVEGALSGVADRQQGDAAHVSQGID